MNHPLIVREVKNTDKKKRIGKVAADLVNIGESLIIDIGTTTLEMAKIYPKK